MDSIHAAADSVFRQESGRIIASLIRISGSFDRAEEAMQEAFASALASWPAKGLPENPAAWIMAVANRKLIDAARKDQTHRQKQDSFQYEVQIAGATQPPLPEPAAMDFPDDRLRLIFTCCHPAINPGGAGRAHSADAGMAEHFLKSHKAFLLPESTLAQRLVPRQKKDSGRADSL